MDFRPARALERSSKASFSSEFSSFRHLLAP